MKIESGSAGLVVSQKLSSLPTQQSDIENMRDSRSSRSSSPDYRVSLTSLRSASEKDIVLAEPLVSQAREEQPVAFSTGAPEQEQYLLEVEGLFESESFLQLKEALNSKEMAKLENVIRGLRVPPKMAEYYGESGSTFRGQKLVDALAAMDESTRSRVLEKADTYADRVTRPVESNTYTAAGIKDRMNPSASVNDLHSFATAVANSSDVNLMMDKVERFDEEYQSTLLRVLRDEEMGHTLMDQLQDRDEIAQSSVLNLIAGLADSATSVISERAFHYYDNGGTHLQESATLDYDNNAVATVWDMIGDTVELMGNYQFSDEQLQDMTGQLSVLERSDQRAYLEITRIGLEHIMGSDNPEPVDMTEQEEVLTTLDALRDNNQVRDLVFKTRMGSEHNVDRTSFYDVKDDGGAQDQRATIEMLVTDAWMVQQNGDGDIEARAGHIATQLLQLEAGERDAFIHNLNGEVDIDQPLSRLSADATKELAAFSSRTNVIVDTADLDKLLGLEASVERSRQDGFWHAVDLADESANKLVDTLSKQSPELQREASHTLAAEAEKVLHGQQEPERFKAQLLELLDAFTKTDSVEEKLGYLEEHFG